MSVYGVSGSGTYAVTLSGLDELMSALPNNTVNQIRAQDARNVVYTLWDSLGGGGGGSFSYTQTAPFSQASVDKVGGIPSGTTFSNVSLQDLLDRMFFPPVGTVFSISSSITSLEFNNPSRTTTITVSITKKNPTINTISVVGPVGSLGSPPTTPTTFNQTSSKSFTEVVPLNAETTYTLNLNDGTPRSAPATVTWFFPRWYGSIDLNQLIDPDLDTKNLTPAQKTLIINKLKNDPVDGDPTWSPVWSGSNLTSFRAGSGQLSAVPSITPKNTTLGSHIVLIWPKTDYGGDGDPTNYTFGVVSGRPFVDLGFHDVENQYGYIRECRIWIRDFKSPGATSFTINN
jgi:hypothetical protein